MVALLKETDYDEGEINFLRNRFLHGFDIGYEGPIHRQSMSKNIPLKVGSATELWNKLIKEVKHKRVAEPFDKVPYKNFIQSPIGLVPKAGNSGKTRLIFHLSYDFKQDNKSLNHYTPKEKCMVKYNDLNHAVKQCLKTHTEAMELHNSCDERSDKVQ